MAATQPEIVPIPEIVPVPPTANDVTTQTPAGDQTGNPPPVIPSQPKKFSVLNFLSSKRKITKSKSLPSATLPADNKTEVEHLALFNLIDQDLSFITETCKKLDTYKGHVNEEAIRARKQLESLKNAGTPVELRKLKRAVTKMKFLISSKYKHSADNEHRKKRANDSEKLKEISEDELLKIMSQFYDSQVLKENSQFLDFLKLYNGLRVELKLCLLCFAVFPEDVVIKKRFMIYWWMGERFVPPIDDESDKTAEEIGNEFFLELIEKGFIEPVFKKRNPVADSCRVHPFIRSILVQLALRAKFFDFNDNGSPTENFSNSFRACLVGEGLVNQQELEKLHMLFNLNEEILDFKPEWFLKMKNISLISLGRWQTSPTHHIELEEVEFLDGLSVMNHLRLLSLQGVSRIMELPDSISHLINLTILDLRACHNLEVIPKEIGKLRSLTHLDMSECYLIEHMPKELALLSQLQVLKGFLVVFSKNKSSCTLRDLSKLENLRKLSIYTGLQEFPFDDDLRALQEFDSLRKLTIAWGGGATSHGKASLNVLKKGKKREHRSLRRQSAFRLALSLEKLDLQCFPGKDASKWLTPLNLNGLKKLYIRGGNLRDLGQYVDFVNSSGDDMPAMDSWKVEILRVKYLSELEMDWGELHELFPDLVYLEKVNCPKLTLFPCDEAGVWMNKAKLKDLRS